ncbi:hemicentin-2-like [Mya arenaria]|uniref:hemicentin-2-like n=1 Tax=Mya arenaria TaxID=6604 RepID=UPI0022E98997|nr:hemicentin-2-like [Mya arenaria]
MDRKVVLMVVLLLNVLTTICRGEHLRLNPALSYLVKAEGDKLQLECIHEYNVTAQGSAYFAKNGKMLTLDNEDDYIITSKTTIINTGLGTKVIKTLIKDSTTLTDNGTFVCKAGNFEISINVIVFQVTQANALYQDNATEVELGCALEGLSPEIPIDFYWYRQNGARLHGDRYNISNNGKLRIEKPTLSDIGSYNCSAKFYPQTEIEQTMFLTSVYLNAAPRILNIECTSQFPLTLKCNVAGFPHPNVTWEQDGNQLNSTVDSLYVFMGESVIVHNKNYSGTYTCLAKNEHQPYNASADIHINVKPIQVSAVVIAVPIACVLVVILSVTIACFIKHRKKEREAFNGTNNNCVSGRRVVNIQDLASDEIMSLNCQLDL